MGRSPASIVLECLFSASLTIKGLEGGNEVVKLGEGFGSLGDDTEIKADRLIGDAIMKLLLTDNDVQRITIEGMPDYSHAEQRKYWVCVDPLDGSLNYGSKMMTIGLPYTTCVTVLSKCSNATFADIIACGVIDHRSDDLWCAYFDDDGVLKAKIGCFTAFTDKRPNLDLGSMIVFGEMYYPENRNLLLKMFSGCKGWLRNPGSAAYEMAMVSSGSAVAFICDRQKQHELGAGYLLVKAAGGVAVDFSGKDLGQYEYVFNAQTPVILAANQNIANELLRRIS
ncbi:MAG: inositol monophosphatase family protein [Patescibacteria group bacterium]|jgi:fructose-1,6-bisphosphatase/inositol monophosphatase family enzyme